MQSIVVNAILLLALMPVVSSISCFVCNGTTTSNCNDPFSSTNITQSSGVNITTGCGGCVKQGVGNIMTRYCSGTCGGISIALFIAGTGVACCSDRDLCNGGQNLQHTSSALLSFMVWLLIMRKIAFT